MKDISRFLRFSFLSVVLSVGICSQQVSANNSDRFNYRETVGHDYGPKDWDKVTCSDKKSCQGWPDGYELGIGWELGDKNKCKWCPADGNHTCGVHHQSPIDLLRTAAETGHDTECYDYHWIAYEDGACKWNHMVKNGYTNPSQSFRINRHGLQILTPIDENTGELQCQGFTTGRQFPRLDYPKGFPDWWYLSHTDITVPSEHTQAGKRYAAEVHLSHFYSVAHATRQIGKVAIFLDVMDGAEHRRRWGFLDKLICQWREVEEETRQECGLESAPPYPGCRNPVREKEEVIPPVEDPYPFVNCDTIYNYQRICKPTSCCEAERSTTDYCVNDVYGKYGDDLVGSICWWCCPNKLLDREEPPPTLSPALNPTTTTSPTTFAPIETISPTTPSPTVSASPTSDMVEMTNLPSQVPSVDPSSVPSSGPSVAPSLPPNHQSFDCEQYDGLPGIDMRRICKDDSCCDPTRSATDHCHYVYAFFQEKMADVCLQCCNPSKQVGPPPPPHPIYPEIDCSLVPNPHRMCKPNSCCDPVRSDSQYCTQNYHDYGESMGSICWYCCSEPKEVDPTVLPPTNAPWVTNNPTTKEPTQMPSYEPTLTSTWVSTPTLMPRYTNTPSDFPSFGPQTSAPTTTVATITPTNEPTLKPTGPFQCSDFDGATGIDMQRICKDGGCCDPIRSSTDHCHRVYKFFGEAMEDVCSDCCDNKELAPPPPAHPVYPPIDCTLVSNPFRICKPTSCCNEERSTTLYCQDVYAKYGGVMGSVCWYCCSTPKEVDWGVSRRLDSVKSDEDEHQKLPHSYGVMDEAEKGGDILLPNGLWSKDLQMDPSNFEIAKDVEERHLASIKEYRKRRDEEQEEAQREGSLRKLQNNPESGDNYINVPYSPYEWMREVRTEYYFRYEGAQMIPPCFETVHYRVMKDPIRIHPIQLAELERLLAWRIAPKGSGPNECQRDTAGRERPGSNGNAVDLNRPLQDYSNIHRKVFCECVDWESKWTEDLQWCQLDKKTRFFDRPYNFL